MSAIVLAGLALVAVLAVGVRWIGSLPYFRYHSYYTPSQEREAAHDPHGGGHG